MTDPVTLTVSGIAALAFIKFIESSAGETAKKLTPAVLSKIDALRQKIWAKLKGIPEVDELNATAEQGGAITEEQIKLLTPHLEAAMKDGTTFAEEVRALAGEINQEINIGEILGKNIMNVSGGTATQVNDASGQVFSGNITGGTFNFGTKS